MKTNNKILEALKQKTLAVETQLAVLYPDAACSLNFTNPYELLVATILSAQCTDERVNIVTPDFFAKWPTADKLAMAELSEIENMVKTTGFFRNKAKSLLGMAQKLMQDFDAVVPADLESLITLPGVGRKTANVVLGNCFGVPGITVDTHVGRLAQRIGLSSNTEPEKIEADLMGLLPSKGWTLFSHRMIYHGRQICNARKPKCEQCRLRELCEFGNK